MKLKKSKAIVFLLAAAMLLANISALTFAAGAAPAAQKEDSNRTAKPVASIKEKKDAGTWEVSLTTATKDADIFYTVDGKAATEKSTKYDPKKPIEIKKTTTVKAIAVKKGLKASEETTFTYTIAKSDSGQGNALVTPTPTPTAKAEATDEPEKDEEPTPANEPAKTNDEAPTEPSTTADEPMNITVSYNGTILVETTSITDLGKVSEYGLQADPAVTNIPFEIKSVAWGQSTTGTSPAPESPADKIMAGKTYNVEITLGIKEGASANPAAPKVTFLKKEFEQASAPLTYQGTIEVPSAVTAAITPNPAAGTTVHRGDKITLSASPEVAGAGIVYSTSLDGTIRKYDNAVGIVVPDSATGEFTVTARMAQEPFAYVGETFRYTVAEEPTDAKIESVTIDNLSYQDRGNKLDSLESKVTVEPADVAVASVRWSDDENNFSEVEEGTILKAGSYYYGYITLTAKNGKEFDTNVFKKDASTGVSISGNGTHDMKPVVTEVSESSLVVRVTNKTTDASKADSKKNKITGLKSSYTTNSTVSFTMQGDSHPEKEGNERYVPVSYIFNVESSAHTISENRPNVTKSVILRDAKTYTLTVTFQKQVYSAADDKWVNVENSTDKENATVRVTSSTSRTTSTPTPRPTSTPSSSSSSRSGSSSSRSSGANTGDQTPIGMYVTLLLIAAATAAGVFVYRRKANGK